MNKAEQQKRERREWVTQQFKSLKSQYMETIGDRRKAERKAITDISNQLFLSPKTITRDLAQVILGD